MKDRAWNEFSERFRKDGLPKIMSSAVCLSIYSGDGKEFDVKQAVEIGAMLLLDKPLVLVVTPGAKIPSRLMKAADVVIHDWSPDNPTAQETLTEAMRLVMGDEA